jgi:hypothetical protein
MPHIKKVNFIIRIAVFLPLIKAKCPETQIFGMTRHREEDTARGEVE